MRKPVLSLHLKSCTSPNSSHVGTCPTLCDALQLRSNHGNHFGSLAAGGRPPGTPVYCFITPLKYLFSSLITTSYPAHFSLLCHNLAQETNSFVRSLFAYNNHETPLDSEWAQHLCMVWMDRGNDTRTLYPLKVWTTRRQKPRRS